MSRRGPIAPVYARTEGRPPVQMMPTRIPKASAHAAFILNLKGGVEISVWASPSGGRAVGFAEIPACAGHSSCRSSIPDAEQASLPATSVGAAMLGSTT
jgi:hypothetical protein